MVRLWVLLLAVLALLVGAATGVRAASTVNSLQAVPTFPFPDLGCPAGSTQNVWISQGSGAGNDYRATINQIDPLFIGPAPPSCPYRYELWANTSLTPPRVNMYTGAAWVTIGALDTTNNLWVPPIGGGVSPVLTAAATTDLGSVPHSNIVITGTTSISSFGSNTPTGQYKNIRFNSVLTLNYNSVSMILPTGLNITTAANDTLTALSLGGGNWMITQYQRASGSPLTISNLGFIPMNPLNNLSDVLSITDSRNNLIPPGTITGAQLQTGAVIANLAYTPMKPANNLSDVQSISAARNTLIPAASILGSQLAAGAAAANLGYTPLNPTAGSVTAAMLAPGAAAGNLGAGSISAAMLAAGAAISNIGYTPLNPTASSVSAAMLQAGVAVANLGFTPFNSASAGSMASQNSNTVNISGGNIGAVTITSPTINSSTINSPTMTTPTINGLSSAGASDNWLCITFGSNIVKSSNTGCGVASDERLKTGWGEAPGLSAIMKLDPASFDWLDADMAHTRGRQVGLSAQQVRKVLPEVVSVGGDATIHPAKGPEITIHDMQSIDYAKLVVPLIKAVQEQQKDIKEIKLHMQR